MKHRKAQQRLFEKGTMKRIGFLYEKITSIDNLILAVRNATKNKKHRRGIVKDAHDNPELYAARVQRILERGIVFSPPRMKTRRELTKYAIEKYLDFSPIKSGVVLSCQS